MFSLYSLDARFKRNGADCDPLFHVAQKAMSNA